MASSRPSGVGGFLRFFGLIAITLHAVVTQGSIPQRYLKMEEELLAGFSSGVIKPHTLLYRSDGGFEMDPIELDVALLVVDTSNSMRIWREDLRRYGAIRPVFLARISRFVQHMASVRRIIVFDTNGYLLFESGSDVSEDDAEIRHSNIVNAIAESVSKPGSALEDGVRAVLKRARNLDQGAAAEVFIFGRRDANEGFWKMYQKFKREILKYPINVVNVMQRLWVSEQYRPRESVLFDRNGMFITGLSGGRFFVFEPSAYARSWQAVVFGELARKYEGEVLLLDAEVERIEDLNRLLRDEFQTDRDFYLSRGASDQGLLVENILIEGVPEKPERVYIQLTNEDGVSGVEYRVSLTRKNEVWTIGSWETLFEMAEVEAGGN